MPIWTPTSAKCAGHISNVIFVATQTGLLSRRPSVSADLSSPATCSPPGAPTSTSTTTATGYKPRSRRSRQNCGNCSSTPHRRTGAPAGTDGSRTHVLKVWPALWTFTTIDGVEPTNNPAERALRGPVIHRKLARDPSDTGERFAERALSAATNLPHATPLAVHLLSELLAAHNRGLPFPALT